MAVLLVESRLLESSSRLHVLHLKIFRSYSTSLGPPTRRVPLQKRIIIFLNTYQEPDVTQTPHSTLKPTTSFLPPPLLGYTTIITPLSHICLPFQTANNTHFKPYLQNQKTHLSQNHLHTTCNIQIYSLPPNNNYYLPYTPSKPTISISQVSEHYHHQNHLEPPPNQPLKTI